MPASARTGHPAAAACGYARFGKPVPAERARSSDHLLSSIIAGAADQVVTHPGQNE
ncbi:hypothetical protein M8494_20965 [Serratia ureilytica]